MSNDIDIISLFREAAAEVSGKKPDVLTYETVISDLGMDSVSVMELVSFFEERLAVRLPDEDLAHVQTIGDLARVVTRARGIAA